MTPMSRRFPIAIPAFASKSKNSNVESDSMHKSRRFLLLIVAAAFMFTFAGNSYAGFLNAFSGNSKEQTTGQPGKITENFAVLDRLTGASTPGDIFGTGLPGFDALMIAGNGSPAFNTGARYLYLYQDVVSPASGQPFVHDGVDNQGKPLGITSYGQWSLFLSDDGGIVSTTNDFGPDGIAFSLNAPANTGVTNASVSSSGPTTTLGGGTITVTSTSFTDQFSPQLTAGQTERIFGFTTNSNPQFLTFASSALSSGGTIPVPAPEPSSLVLLGAGGLGLLAYILRRRARLAF